ncbi:MAG: hypothetical protein KGQ46_10495 [Hyphomicrobiales bacterium]|nr:hypothetical protein [Hyphomicrobiales bacterium]MDE2115113.1 hypothetical protein [Hyphomicrobiales bacterium]
MRKKKMAACTRGCAALLLVIAVSGCAETGIGMADRQSSAPEATADAHGASISLVSLSGAPDSVQSRFSSLFGDSANRHEIKLATTDSAQYFTKGYIAADKTSLGTQISAVWDVFDLNKKYVTRISSDITVASASTDAWAAADADNLRSLADQSANRLAAYLSKSVSEKPDTPAQTPPASSEPAPQLPMAKATDTPPAASAPASRLALASANSAPTP